MTLSEQLLAKWTKEAEAFAAKFPNNIVIDYQKRVINFNLDNEDPRIHPLIKAQIRQAAMESDLFAIRFLLSIFIE